MEKMLNEIKAISKKQSVDIDRAFDMFRSNCEQGRESYQGTESYDYSSCPKDEVFGELRKELLNLDRKNA